MSFLDRITERRHILFEALEALKSRRNPLVLAGAGFRAARVSDLLKRHGLAVDFFAVNEKYIGGPHIVKEPVHVLEEIAAREGPYDYIACFPDLKTPLPNAASIHYFNVPQCCSIEDGYVIPREFYAGQADRLQELADDLADDLSRDILAAFINQVIRGNFDYLKRYETRPQYFAPDLISRTGPEIFIDGGAFDGDTIADFIKTFGLNEQTMPDEIHAFEPGRSNFAKLSEKFSPLRQVHLHPYALWNRKETLNFTAGENPKAGFVAELGGRANHSGIDGNFKTKHSEVQAVSLDEFLPDCPVTFIKLDCEGAEMMALAGMRNLIGRHKPKLAICVYHKKEDIFAIPWFIRSLVPDYEFYIRVHDHLTEELVLYGRPPGRLARTLPGLPRPLTHMVF